MIYFSADHHFGHSRIIEYANRPFKDVEEMDAAMIGRWNKTVSPNDTVYYPGDFTLLGFEQAQGYFAQLNGRIIIIPGGHDHWARTIKREGKTDSDGFYYHLDLKSKSGRFVLLADPLYTLKVPDNKQQYTLIFVLCHYPMLRWDRSHYGSFHLFGHVHGNLKTANRSMDVGVDAWNYWPLTIDFVTGCLWDKQFDEKKRS
jgi:calcineurin-like phosphoesterase family protein